MVSSNHVKSGKMGNSIFRDKVVIITGASSGIGEAASREFARKGSKVVMAARSLAKMAAIADEIKAGGGEASYIETDVSKEADCRRMVEFAVSRYSVNTCNESISTHKRSMTQCW